MSGGNKKGNPKTSSNNSPNKNTKNTSAISHHNNNSSSINSHQPSITPNNIQLNEHDNFEIGSTSRSINDTNEINPASEIHPFDLHQEMEAISEEQDESEEDWEQVNRSQHRKSSSVSDKDFVGELKGRFFLCIFEAKLSIFSLQEEK